MLSAKAATGYTGTTEPVDSTSQHLLQQQHQEHQERQQQQEYQEEEQTVRMRILISKGKDLAAKDMNGFSDPYVKVTIGGHRFTTKVVRKSLNPVWNAYFDFDLEPQSVPDSVNLMFWDKDWIGKDDFMGVVNISFDEASIFADAVPKHFDDPMNQAIEVKFGFIDTALAPSNETSRADCAKVWSVLSAGRNKLGLGQRTIQSPENNTTMSMADIPMAGAEADPTLGPNDARPDSISNPSGASTNLHGVVFMEVVSAANLPKLHNVTRTGFDMDPFVVISFGKYIFRTRVVRHNLNPVWKAKLMFRVHLGEETFRIKYSVHDWDKLSGNDHVGVAIMDVDSLIQAANVQDEAPQRVTNGQTGDIMDPDMKDYILKIDLDPGLKVVSEDPHIRIRAKFVPYTTLRRRFWHGLAKSYNTDNNNGLYNKVLIQTMLEGLGSTLSSKTVDGFFAPFNKDPEHDELTFDELFERLERQVRVDDHALGHADQSATKKRWFGRPYAAPNPLNAGVHFDQEEQEEEDQEDAELYLHLTRNQVPRDSSPEAHDMEEPTEADFDPQTSEEEHLIRISTCPICHDSSLGHKLKTDVITHIAVCSGNDGFNLDKLILGNFVTEANAQRKWITKAVKSLGYGRYVVGRSNANIIVQDRATGAMMEEKIPTFIRLGIRLLYKSPANKIRVGKILADMSRRQGLKFNDPRSKRDIEPFIRFHGLEAQMKEVLEPIENFKNFNEFFYRKLKPTARTLAAPGNDRVAVSVADCRMTCFQTIADATQFWIKGRQFTIAKLVRDETLAKKYDGGSLAIFRLAPQDYHRYHIPVKGVLSKPNLIEGEYYTVNPMAIRSQLDVYGENKRVVSTIESKEFGTVSYVAIGAMMVGSIVLTTEAGQQVERMDEHGYFAFGGSTIVLLFEPNTIRFDEDLLRSSKEQIEMLVKVGMQVGVSTRAG
ncbi:hypothetical protein EDD11_003316 [Mortierella claussenii]|nr:hypothetical protein EDD11_003316 [Mortierella claussenii]